MKKILLTVVCAFAAIVAWSASYDKVSLDLNDGTKVDIALSEKLTFSFNETHLLVAGTDADFEIPKDKIVTFSHSGSTGLSEVAAESGVDIQGRTMHFKGLPSGSVIKVYSLSGQCRESATAEGDYVFELDKLPAGVYIVTVNNVSYKISLK